MLRKQASTGAAKTGSIPLCERLGEYPAGHVDLDNIVVYPPEVQAIPAKPLFLDIAWNYVEYPDKKGRPEGKARETLPDRASEPEQKPQKRGWFWSAR